MLCAYKDMFGKVGEGIHSYRIANIAVADIIFTIIGAFFTSYSFYYNTISNISELNDSKIETAKDIKDLKNDVNEIKINLSNTGIYTTNNKEQINNLNSDIKEIRKSQEEMMKILIEMNGKRR